MRTRSILAACAAILLSACSPQGQGNELTVISFGGAYQQAQHDAYMAPFAAARNVRVTEGEYNGDYGVMRERATAGVGAWDVVSVESGPALRGQQEDIFLPLPDRIFEGLPLVEGTRRANAAGHLLFSTILAYRDDAAGPRPTTWADFWNTTAFPGRRGLRNNPRGTLEIALLADGVAPNQLYPLDVERALRKLDQIRDNVVFWDSGAQPLQLLANNTVAMTSVYNGRAWAARNDEHLPIGWSMTQGLLEFEFWAVPRNARNPELAFDFIRFSLEREQQAAFANRIAYIPTNQDARPLISETIRAAVPDTSPAGGQIAVDAAWWAEHEAEVAARWQQWQAAR